MSTSLAGQDSDAEDARPRYWPFVFSGLIGAVIPLIVLGLTKLF